MSPKKVDRSASAEALLQIHDEAETVNESPADAVDEVGMGEDMVPDQKRRRVSGKHAPVFGEAAADDEGGPNADAAAAAEDGGDEVKPVIKAAGKSKAKAKAEGKKAETKSKEKGGKQEC